MTTTATCSLLRLDQPGVRKRLSAAPVGEYGLLEVAFAWHEHHTRSPKPPTGRREPILTTELEGAAERIVRLLSTVTWATATPIDPAARRPPWIAEQVDVPVQSFHRTTRLLRAEWRTRRRFLTRPATPRAASRAAIALFRMATLLGGFDRPTGGLTVNTGTVEGADTLIEAATLLGIAAERVDRHAGATIVLAESDKVSGLLAASGWSPELAQCG